MHPNERINNTLKARELSTPDDTYTTEETINQLKALTEKLCLVKDRITIDHAVIEIETAIAEAVKLRAERDEARRYSCDLEARIIVLEEDRRDTSNKFGTNPCSEIILPDYPLAREPKEIAKRKGWDCFKENTND